MPMLPPGQVRLKAHALFEFPPDVVQKGHGDGVGGLDSEHRFLVIASRLHTGPSCPEGSVPSLAARRWSSKETRMRSEVFAW